MQLVATSLLLIIFFSFFPHPQCQQLIAEHGNNPYYAVNLAPFGPETGDSTVNPAMLTTGITIDLHTFFPFYGGLYNYTTISVNGYLGFANVLDQGSTINVGPDATDWPRQEDPAMIAPYLCKQQIPQQGLPARRAGVYYRLVLRRSESDACATPDSYVRCDTENDDFLNEMMTWLQEGVAGGGVFRADAALVVTWFNTASAVSGRSDIDAGHTASYQAVWLTDAAARLSYVILNYERLGFDAQDFRQNSRSGRCRALFNGGNHTGSVEVDPTQPYKNTPKVLAQRSGVPQMVRGRYMFRVDDVVRPVGCSNKTGGTYPITIYPNIVNMLGDMTVDVNACCLDRSHTYILMIEERDVASCHVINAAIARCSLPRIYDWGVKTVYFQPQSSGANDEKAFVGYIYFVPPTIDPMRLDIGNIYDWYKNPMTDYLMPITWYPRNFTNPRTETVVRVSDESRYAVQLGLYIIGYREHKDDEMKKIRPEYRTLARVATYTNRNGAEWRWTAQEEVIDTNRVEQWFLTERERTHELFSYRVGFFKLTPLNPNDQNGTTRLLPGLVSAPISLHWLWTSEVDREARVAFVKEKSRDMCHDWYDEDGAETNFIRDVETSAPCPCIEKQALLDLGRFMPHPRCSQTFRDIACTTLIGSKNCYMSASSVFSNGETRTHHGQVCCYDEAGFLMQTPYQPVIRTQTEFFYNPGYPLRANEFGTPPYMGQFEVPGLSAFHNDYMPYFLCCKFADFRCQMFYWRRPSSACQQYRAPAIGHAQGTGVFQSIDGRQLIFNEPGVFTFLHIPQADGRPEVRIQTRLERYPNRRIDFGMLGRHISQFELVQPTNATVITGIALEATGTDRVIVTARKDTRRFRYRTNIIVGNILRYFDTVHLQRFRGCLVYVDNVQRGQPEVYVVLEEAQIGVKVTESYALDIDRLADYQESMGMLDIRLSVSELTPHVFGLIRPFPDDTNHQPFNDRITIDDVNSDVFRQQIIENFKFFTSSITTQAWNQVDRFSDMVRRHAENMFETSRDEDRKFDVFPEASMRSEPIFKTAPAFETGAFRFVAQSGAMIVQLLDSCRSSKTSQCPDDPELIVSECGDSVPCLYDYTLLNSKVLAKEELNEWNLFISHRESALRQYNSCGAINIEYPEYLMKTPPLAPAYLQGDIVRFECFQSHWIKGHHEYACGGLAEQQWNKGAQPWCRSRVQENYFRWLAAVLGTVAVVILILLVFLLVWCLKQKRRLLKVSISSLLSVISSCVFLSSSRFRCI